MKISFFNTFEPVVPLYRELLPHLSEQHIDVSAILATSEYRPGEELVNKNNLTYKTVHTLKFPSLQKKYQKALTHGSYYISATIEMLRDKSDLNVFLTQPPLFNNIGNALKRTNAQKYACIVMDLYPQVAIEAGLLKANSKLAIALTRLSVNTLKTADLTIVIGRCMKQRLLALGVPARRIQIIPNWANTEHIKPVPLSNNLTRRQLALQNKFVVMYSGNMGVSHYFLDILQVAERMQKNGNETIAFLFAGTGNRRQEIESYIKQKKLKNCIVQDYSAYSQLSERLSVGDIHFISLRNNFEGLVVPSKTYGVMAAGRPIIYQGHESGEIAQMINDSDIGRVVPQGDTEMLYYTILELQRDKKQREQMGRDARKLCEERYSTPAMLKAYTVAFSEILNN